MDKKVNILRCLNRPEKILQSMFGQEGKNKNDSSV